MRQGAEAGARAGSEVRTAQSKADINQALQNQRDTMRQAPIKTGLNIAQAENSVANQAMTQAIANMRERNAGMSAVGSAFGQGIGAYFGSRSNSPDSFQGSGSGGLSGGNSPSTTSRFSSSI